MKRIIVIVAVFLVFVSMLEAGQAPAKRPEHWAVPMSVNGVPNLHRVSDNLYRSAQPTAEGMLKLKEMGVRTIVNLRSFHSDRDIIENTGLAYEQIRMKAWNADEKDIIIFLQIITSPEEGPFLVHCQHGADRTGTAIAVYRVAVQGWTKEEAVMEMTEGGFGFHRIWGNLIRWINRLDIDAIKNKAGIRRTGGINPHKSFI